MTRSSGDSENEVSLAGADHGDPVGDVRWALDKPERNLAIRLIGVGMRKALRRSTERVTWDRRAFQRATRAAAPGSTLILAPSHRSYFDFLLSSYVCFQHPELGIAVPHVAAADDFQRIPVVGRLLRTARAFYIPRGRGREVAEVNEHLARLTKRESSLMFFIEGQRSRSRLVLPPKRGLLRGLQATGHTFTILPIAMSYDRVPEATALEKELVGGDKPPMSLRAILSWLAELERGRVWLGRMHIGCGEALMLDPGTDVRALSKRIVAEQQAHTTITGFHLRSFLATATRQTAAARDRVDEPWLAAAIEARGGRVLASRLAAPEPCSAALSRSLRNQWMHWFYPDALALYPAHPVIRDHVSRHGWVPRAPQPPSQDPRVKAVVDSLFAPILADYMLTLDVLERTDDLTRDGTPRAIVRAHPGAHLPVVQDAFALLRDQHVLESLGDGTRVSIDRARLRRLRAEWAAASFGAPTQTSAAHELEPPLGLEP